MRKHLFSVCKLVEEAFILLRNIYIYEEKQKRLVQKKYSYVHICIYICTFEYKAQKVAWKILGINILSIGIK